MMNIATDTGLLLSVRWVLGMVFLIGAIHKVRSPAAFVATLSGYRLLPVPAVAAAAWGILVAECLVAALLVSNTRAGSAGALLLLTIYTLAITINMIRGRRDIDCGCAGPAVRQTLSVSLVFRNIGLMALSLLSLAIVASPRDLQLLDWFTALLAAATFGFIYAAATQLSSTSGRLRPL